MDKSSFLKRVLVIAMLLALFVMMLGGCDDKENTTDTWKQQYDSCITQKKAAGVTDQKACELCGGKNCGQGGGTWK